MVKLIIFGAIVFALIVAEELHFSTPIIVIGLVIATYYIGKMLLGGAKWGAKTTSNIVSQRISDNRDDARKRKDLELEIERAKALAQIETDKVLAIQKGQLEYILAEKLAGKDVEKELMEMRSKLVQYENEDFSSLINTINKNL